MIRKKKKEIYLVIKIMLNELVELVELTNLGELKT